MVLFCFENKRTLKREYDSYILPCLVQKFAVVRSARSYQLHFCTGHGFFYGVNVKINKFFSVLDRTPKESTIQEFIEEIRTEVYKSQIELIRSGNSDVKRLLPAVTLSGTFEGSRAARNAVSHSGIIQIDIDKVGDAETVKRKLSTDPHVMFCFISPSGNGVKAGFKVPADITLHKESFNQVKQYIYDKYVLEMDKSCSDISRLCLVSSDSDVYVNYDCEEFEVHKPVVLQSKKNIVHVQGTTKARESTAQKTVDTVIKKIAGATNGNRHLERRSAGMLCGGLVSGGYISEVELMQIVEPYIVASTSKPQQALKNFIDAVEYGKGTPLQMSKAEERERKAINSVKHQYKEITGEELEDESEICDVREIHMKTLGMQSDSYVLYNNRKGSITVHGTIDKKILLDHVPFDFWQSIYSEDGKAVNWDQAVSDVMTECGNSGFFDTNVVRGKGVWNEGKTVVVNCGDTLVIDGKETKHLNHRSNYIYNRSSSLGIKIGRDDIPVGETALFFEAFSMLPLHHHSDKVLFCGWVVAATIAGALKWRPHFWINAPAESGKSWILDHIVKPYLGKLAVSFEGQETTEAGIRQMLGADSMAVIHDESEGKNEKGRNALQSKLMLARMCSTDSDSGIVKGGKDGKAVKFAVRSMFLFSSTKIPELDKADADRFTQISITARERRENAAGEFKALKNFVMENLSEHYLSSLRNTVISNIPVIREIISVFHDVIAQKGNGVRYADQLSPLFACSWFVLNKTVPDVFEADIFFTQYGMEERTEDRTSEEKKCAEVILQLVPPRQDLTVFELLCGAKFRTRQTYKSMLSRIGMSVSTDGEHVLFENSNHQLKEMLRNTSYVDTYKADLTRLDGARTALTVRIAGRPVRGFSVPFVEVVGDVDESELNIPEVSEYTGEVF